MSKTSISSKQDISFKQARHQFQQPNMQPNGGSGLSQYFADDPPSIFDQIPNNRTTTNESGSAAVASTTTAVAAKTMLATGTKNDSQASKSLGSGGTNSGTGFLAQHFLGSYKPVDYTEDISDAADTDVKVQDDVRNMWKPPDRDPLRPPLLTKPGVQIAEDLPDKIAEAVTRYLGASELVQRKILDIDGVTQDERGLRKLIANGCYRSAVNLTGRLLTIYGQGYGRAGQPTKHSPHSMQLWFTRLALLAKLGEYETLQIEAEPFDDLTRPDIYFEFYPEMYKDRRGSIASFSFRLFLAELPIYLGNASMALDKLAEIYTICNDIKTFYTNIEEEHGEHAAVLFWRKRVLRTMHSIVNCALVLKKYNLIDDLLKEYSEDEHLTKSEKRALFSAWGRIYLQIGDVFGAEQKFAEGRRLRDMNETPSLRDLVDKGLVALAHNNFPEAYSIFQKALHLDNSNTMVLNNMGVCLLYAGKLKDAINLLERAINMNPQRSLDESLLINLSTLYELESNNSLIKKKNLLRLISMYKPDLKISLEICLKLGS